MVVRVRSEAEFEQLLSRHEWVVVDFWAEWCPPCIVFEPVFEDVSKEFPGVVFARVNVDEVPRLASRYSVMAIPMVLLFHKGNPVDGFLGYKDHKALRAFLSQHISGKGNYTA
ncbi:thioredoxin family protein [archaeon]|nr:thioredoxin family protein [archaeon]